MKTVAVLGVLFVLSQVEGRSVEPSANAVQLSPLQEQCLQELKLEDKRADIANINNQAICPENNTHYNSFISCFWKKTGRQNAGGEVNYDTVKSFVREGIIKALGNDPAATNFAEANSVKIVNGCKDISGETAEKTVVKFRNCIVRGLNEISEN